MMEPTIKTLQKASKEYRKALAAEGIDTSWIWIGGLGWDHSDGVLWKQNLDRWEFSSEKGHAKSPE
jgi:hypothetical protein